MRGAGDLEDDINPARRPRKAWKMDEDHVQWLHVVFRVGMTAAAHPIEYVKVLIQLGHEPLPPRQTRTFFGKAALGLPGVFEYMGFIKKTDGILGLYRGVTPRICGNLISGYVFGKVTELIDVQQPQNDGELDESLSEEKVSVFVQRTCRDMVSRSLAIIASQPFQVISVRVISQFIGKETKYSGGLASIKEIYNHDGILGFFSGLTPRLLSEILSLWLCGTLCFIVNSYLVEDLQSRGYVNASIAFVASAVTYPFTVVSNVMAVNDSGLAAGSPPNMPIYVNWTDCWRQLSAENQLKRGSSLVWRYYMGPTTMIGNEIVSLKLSSTMSKMKPSAY